MLSTLADNWDACVVGGGPAGSLAASLLGEQGFRILLVDKAVFPRYKVCGGCVGAAGLDALRDARLSLERLAVPTEPLRQLHIRSPQRSVSLRLGRRQVVDRERFDAALLKHAQRSGVVVLNGCRASIGNTNEQMRCVVLRRGSEIRELRARLVLLAAGLNAANSIVSSDEKIDIRRRRGGYFGVASVFRSDDQDYPMGCVNMVCDSRHRGYVGIVRIPDNRLDLAAAIAPRALHVSCKNTVEATTPASVIEDMIRECRLPLPLGFRETKWEAVPTLTQRPRRLALTRLFLIGDAAGYVEPFTGEGIGWALRQAVDIAPIASSAIEQWQPELTRTWTRHLRASVGRSQNRCRMITSLVGGRRWTPLILRVLSIAPWLGEQGIRRIDRSR